VEGRVQAMVPAVSAVRVPMVTGLPANVPFTSDTCAENTLVKGLLENMPEMVKVRLNVPPAQKEVVATGEVTPMDCEWAWKDIKAKRSKRQLFILWLLRTNQSIKFVMAG
jgi:hypothetical protein